MFGPTLSLPRISQEISINAFRFHRGIGQVESRFERFSRNMARIGGGITMAISIPFQIMAGSAIKAFADLEDAAFSAAARTGNATKSMVNNIVKMSQIISTRVPKSSVDIAKGIEALIQTGMKEPVALIAAENFAKYAYLGNNMEMDKAVTQIVGTFKGLGLATGDTAKDLKGLYQVMDVVSLTADSTNATFDTMAESMSRAAPDAKIYGVELQQLASLMGAYHDANIRGARAGTFFGMMMKELTDKAIRHEDVWENILGKNAVYDIGGKLKDPGAIIENMMNVLSEHTPKAVAKMLIELQLSKKSRGAIFALLGMTEGAKKTQEALKNAGGYMKAEFDFRVQSMSAQLTLAWSRFKILGFLIGQQFVPYIQKAITWITKITEWFSNLSTKQKDNVVWWTLLVSISGPAIMALGFLAQGIYVLRDAFVALKIAQAGSLLFSGISALASMKTAGAGAGALGLGSAAKGWAFSYKFFMEETIPFWSRSLGLLTARFLLLRTAMIYTLVPLSMILRLSWTKFLAIGSGVTATTSAINLIKGGLLGLVPILKNLFVVTTLRGATNLLFLIELLNIAAKKFKILSDENEIVTIGGKKYRMGDLSQEYNSPTTSGMYDPSTYEQSYGFLQFQKMYLEGLEATLLDPEATMGRKMQALDAAVSHGVMSLYEASMNKMALESPSGFSASDLLGFGTKDYDMLNKKKRGAGVRQQPFSAYELGSTEEYRARVLGQNQLTQSTDSLLGQARRTAENTRQTNTELRRANLQLEELNNQNGEAGFHGR